MKIKSTKIKSGMIHSTEKPYFNFLDMENTPPSVENLTASLTINGITVMPQWRYTAGGGMVDQTQWKPWGYGEILTLSGSGDAPQINAGSPLFGKLDDSVKFKNFTTQSYVSTTAKPAQIGTDDMVLEFIIGPVKNNDVPTQIVIDACSEALWKGWYVQYAQSSGPNLTFVSYGGGGVSDYILTTTKATIFPSLSAATYVAQCGWHHVLFLLDRNDATSNGSMFFIDGVANNVSDVGVSHAAHAASLDTTYPLYLGRAGTKPSSCFLSYAALWRKADWHPGGAANASVWASLASIRFKQLMGLINVSNPATNFVVNEKLNTSANQFLYKYSDRYGYRAFCVKPTWASIHSRKCPDGGLAKGLKMETGTATIGYTTTFTNCKVINPTNQLLPFLQPNEYYPSGSGQLLLGQSVTSSAGVNGVHSMAGAVGLWVPGEYNSAVYFVKYRNKSWVKITNTTIANCYAYYNILTGQTGSRGAGCSYSFIRRTNVGDQDYMIGMVFNPAGASNSITIGVSDADGSDSWVGDGATNLTFNSFVNANPEIQRSSGMDFNFFGHAGGGLSNLSQSLYADISNIIQQGKGTLSFKTYHCFPLAALRTTDHMRHISLKDETNNSNYINCYVGSSSLATLKIVSGSTTQVTLEGTTNIRDSKQHVIKASWNTNDVKLYVDGVLEKSSTSCNIPTNLKYIYFCSGSIDDGIISDVKLWNSDDTKIK